MTESAFDTPHSLGYIHSVETFGALDGPGIRYVLFLQGCPLRCRYCHNPDTWQAGQGKRMAPRDVVRDILRYRNFIASGGVTISGGEPMLQPEFCLELLRLCRKNGLHTAIDTGGGVPLEKCLSCVDEADLILLDIKALDPEECKSLTGKDNTGALDILNRREQLSRDVWIRHVLVPGITLERGRLERLADFLQLYRCVKRVELLPFHKMGAYKWDALGIPFTLADTPEPSSADLQMAREIFTNRNIPV